MKKLGFFALCMLISGVVHAAATVVGKVVYAGTYGNGDVYVALSATINEPGCPSSRFDVPVQNPSAKSVLASAYAALASGKTVRVSTNGCYGVSPTLDTTRNTWFLME